MINLDSFGLISVFSANKIKDGYLFFNVHRNSVSDVGSIIQGNFKIMININRQYDI